MDRLVEEDDLPAMDSDDDQFLLEMSEESMEANETTAKDNNAQQHTPTKGQKPIDFIKGDRSGLSVSDLVNQFWCEQQFEYSYTQPLAKPPLAIQSIGSAIHLERELEVHEIFDIECRTNEDSWALRMLNMYQQLSWLIEGATVRELTIFGNVWKDELFINGVIDEIKLDGNKKLEIHELKTRTVKKMPAKAQQTKDKLQAMIYRKLVHDLLFRKCGLQALKKHVPLNWNLVLNYNLQMYANELLGPCSTLNEVFNILDGFLRFVKFPELGSAVIEYCYQRDRSNIGFKKYQYDEMWLRSTIYHQLDYILGRREPVGVDIEEAWKCGRCDYCDSCAWRKTEEKKLKERNTSNFTHN